MLSRIQQDYAPDGFVTGTEPVYASERGSNLAEAAIKSCT